MKYSEVWRILRKYKCFNAKAGKRHDMWWSPITNKFFPVPRHGTEEAKKGTLKSISEWSGVKF